MTKYELFLPAKSQLVVRVTRPDGPPFLTTIGHLEQSKTAIEDDIKRAKEELARARKIAADAAADVDKQRSAGGGRAKMATDHLASSDKDVSSAEAVVRVAQEALTPIGADIVEMEKLVDGFRASTDVPFRVHEKGE